ncbi:MAG: hypothetical protein ABSH10_07340 [Phycisphaerae bacterium]
MPERRVAITGLGVVTSAGVGIESLWQAMLLVIFVVYFVGEKVKLDRRNLQLFGNNPIFFMRIPPAFAAHGTARAVFRAIRIRVHTPPAGLMVISRAD